jgi:tetratricopeptide (TPR) repeat protein
MIERTHLEMSPSGKRPWLAFAAVAILSVLVLFLPLQIRRPAVDAVREKSGTNSQQPASSAVAPRANPFARNRPRMEGLASEMPPEQVVSNKVSQFARNRRAVVEAFAKKNGIAVGADVQRFFDALEAGDWAQADGLFKGWEKRFRDLHTHDGNAVDEPPPVDLSLWQAVKETYHVAETTHEWPAQKLLDYGNAVLNSLRPGMVYVSGTDSGHFIPTLLNETSDGERHVVLTHAAFADGSYLKYAEFLYGERLQTLTMEDSQTSFQDYMNEAQQRLAKNQLRPGEDIKVVDNRVQVSGQVAVMAINEGLLNRLMQKNPDLNFALEEFYPLKSTYAAAVPLGPILELRASDEPLSREQAQQSVNYWKTTLQNLSDESPLSETRKAYASMASAQGNLLALRAQIAEAEQAYRIAREMSPSYPGAVSSLYQLLTQTGRRDEAEAMLNEFSRDNPDQSVAVRNIRAPSTTPQ